MKSWSHTFHQETRLLGENLRSQAHHDGKRNNDVLRKKKLFKRGTLLIGRGMALKRKKDNRKLSKCMNCFVSEIVSREKGSHPRCPIF